MFQSLSQTKSPNTDQRKKMSLPRGTYSFVNRQSGTAIEMTSDHIVVGMPPKDLDTQRWEVHPLGAGHSIRNVKYGKYLSIKAISKESPVVASDFPVAWHVKEIRVAEENAAFYEIRWPMTDFTFELADFGSSSPKTKIYLSEGPLPADQQRCRYWKANRIRQNSFYQPAPPAAQSQGNANGVGSGILGFADKWKSLVPGRGT